MARASVTSPPTDELYLIQGEMPETRDVEDARQWVTIYRELATFAERTLNRLRNGEDNRQAVALVSHDADERSMEAHFRRLQSRLDFWEHRLWELRSEEHTSELQSRND